MAFELIVQPLTAPLQGSVPVPSDTNLLLSRVAVAVLSRGVSSFQLSYPGSALDALLLGLGAVGVQIERGPEVLRIHGAGLHGFQAVTEPLDCRGEAWSAALLLGLLAGRNFESVLYVDASVGETLGGIFSDMGLAERFALNDGFGIRLLAQKERPSGFEVGLTGVLPWVKQALVLLALRASTPSVIEESVGSADHLERALFRSRAPVAFTGPVISIHPPRDDDALAPAQYEDIGSPDLAAFVASTALLFPGSQVGIRGTSSNPTRADFWTLCRLHGGTFGLSPLGDRQGEPFAELSLSGGPLGPISLAGEMGFRLGDGLIPLLVLAARARGVSEFRDVALSSGDASVRSLARLVGYLRAAGVDASLDGGTLRVVGTGGARFRALQVTTGGDGRLALFGTLLGLYADGPSTIDDVECLRKIFPRWIGTLRALGAKLEVREKN